MTSEKTNFGSVVWKSERFNKDWRELQANAVFYEDDDPRIELVVDRFGNEILIVGYTEPIVFNVGYGKDIPRHHIGIMVKDNSVTTFDDWLLGD